jgi:hypothetical protein
LKFDIIKNHCAVLFCSPTNKISWSSQKTRMLATLLFLAAPFVYAQAATGPPPASADNGAPGGIFGMTNSINLGALLGKSGGSKPSLGTPAPKSSSNGSSFLETLAKGGNGNLETALGGLMGGRGPEGVPGGTLNAAQWADPGTGPYPAQYFTGTVFPLANYGRKSLKKKYRRFVTRKDDLRPESSAKR